MAVTAVTLDAAQRIQMLRQFPTNARRFGNVLVIGELPFDRVNIDGTDYYEPCDPVVSTPNGIFQRGIFVGAEYFDQQAPALPMPRPGDLSQRAVWMYGGI